MCSPTRGELEREVAELERRLEVSEQSRRALELLDYSQQSIVATDPNGVVTYWNRYATVIRAATTSVST